jgi:hypothetical protein
MSYTWKRRKTFLLEHHLWAAVLWRRAALEETSHRRISEMLGRRHPTVAQYALTGRSILTVNRAIAIANFLNMSRRSLTNKVDALQLELEKKHKNLTVITAWPSHPPTRTQRILRATAIERNMSFGNRSGEPWEAIFDEDVVECDDMWRARILKGWSRWDAALKFGVAEGTIVSWERHSLPKHRWNQAIQVYGSALP